MKDEKVIVRIPRNASEELVIRTGIYWNIDILDIRWFRNGNPTQKGVRVNKDEARLLLRALQKSMVNENDEQESD
jgi:hypothetical protein